MNKYRVCVYAICKNEEQFVNRWVNSMKEADDIYVLEQWQEKAKTSKYYKTAIKVWTDTDPKKMQTAMNNNLNYFVIYNKEDLHDFITRIQAICKEHPISTR